MDYLKPGLARRRAVLNCMMDGISGAKVLDPTEKVFCHLINTISYFLKGDTIKDDITIIPSAIIHTA